ncbi:RNA polymerase II largest subunit [Pisolithus tinctorius]|nr:RNA polymerase II largest subunit [Pisolithus tinctorius]
MAGQEGLIDIAVKTGGKGMSNDVCYDGTVCNLLGDLIQLIYREDGMHGVFIMCQRIDMFRLSDRDPEVRGFIKNSYMHGSSPVAVIHFPSCRQPHSHCMPVNLHHIIQSAVQIFHINHCKSSDLEPTYTADVVHQLHREVSREVWANTLLTFRMHVRAILATHCILEEFHFNHEVFEWVLGEVQPYSC